MDLVIEALDVYKTDLHWFSSIYKTTKYKTIITLPSTSVDFLHYCVFDLISLSITFLSFL